MSIASETNRNNYIGNGAALTYSYTFKIFNDDELRVTVKSTLDVETTLTLNTHYTVTGAGSNSGGSISLVNGAFAWITSTFLASGYALTIRRDLELIQETDIRNQGEFFPEIHEDVFDRLTMLDQQQQDELSRSVKLSETSVVADFDPTLPAGIVGEVNKVLMTNATGDGFEVGPTASAISSAAADAAAAAASAAAALVSELAAAASAAAALVSENNADTSETNAAASAAAAAAAVSAHEADTTSIHGITDTADLNLKSTLTTKGDLYVATASAAIARQAIGTDGQVLTADSAQTNGVIWASPSSSPTASYEISNLGLATSVGSSALTIALKQADGATNPSTGASAVKVGMRSSTLTSGLYNQRSATAATSLVISSGSTLGQTSNRAARLYIYLIDNAGTLELAVSQTLFPESQLVSTTAEGGAGAADSGTVMYSTTARSSVPFRLVGFLDNTQTTAGTWASAGTKLQAGQYGALTSEKPGCLYTGTPTGTLANAQNLMTFPTVVNDAYSMYSSGLATIKISGFYNIAAASSQAATYIAGSSAVTIIAIDGTAAYTSVENASGAAGVLYPKISVNNIFLLAGQQVSILSLNNGTTPTFTNSLTGSNWFSLIKVQ